MGVDGDVADVVRAEVGRLDRRLQRTLGPRELEVLRSAAQGGDSAAAVELGARVLTGRGATLDADEGIRWIKAAADGGDPDALAVAAALEGLRASGTGSWD